MKPAAKKQRTYIRRFLRSLLDGGSDLSDGSSDCSGAPYERDLHVEALQRRYKLENDKPTNERTLTAIENVTVIRFWRPLAIEVEAAVPKLPLRYDNPRTILINSTVAHLMQDAIWLDSNSPYSYSDIQLYVTRPVERPMRPVANVIYRAQVAQ